MSVNTTWPKLGRQGCMMIEEPQDQPFLAGVTSRFHACARKVRIQSSGPNLPLAGKGDTLRQGDLKNLVNRYK